MVNIVQILTIRSTHVDFEQYGKTIRVMSDKLTDRRLLQKLSNELKVFIAEMGQPRAKPGVNNQVIRNRATFLHEFCRKYGPSIDGGDTYWISALNDGRNRGGKPYYCPLGWKRYTIQIRDLDGSKFAQRYDDWYVAYHGTKFEFALSILLSGFCGATNTAHGGGLYLSPSIIYCAHPQYAAPKQIDFARYKDNLLLSHVNSNYNGSLWIQCVFQVRVNPVALQQRGSVNSETLGIGNGIIDPNFSNSEMEWVISGTQNTLWDFSDENSDVIASGIMIRITNKHPQYLKESKWWNLVQNEQEMDAKYLF